MPSRIDRAYRWVTYYTVVSPFLWSCYLLGATYRRVVVTPRKHPWDRDEKQVLILIGLLVIAGIIVAMIMVPRWPHR